MYIQIIVLIIGLLLITVGADKLVDGASKIARRFGLSDFLIGMTIVGIGTSAPEMVVSFISAFEGNADIAVGNIVGSNIFNILAIIGISAIITPIPLTSHNIRKDIPIVMGASALLCLFVYLYFIPNTLTGPYGTISRIEGIIFLLGFIAFMWYSIKDGKQNCGPCVEEGYGQDTRTQNNCPAQPASTAAATKVYDTLWFNSLLIPASLAALVFGGNIFVGSASAIAKSLGVSDAVIAATIMAGGTSLPELATCVAAALKKNTDMALGNVIGSNVANILLILGGSALITPLSAGGITPVYMITMVAAAAALFIASFTFAKKQVDRAEGVIFIAAYILFVWYILQ